PILAGSWLITFFLEPFHSQGATQCVIFTIVSQGQEEFTGRWTSPTFPGWQGDWLQDGDHIQWFGFTAGGLATSEFGHLPSNMIISGEFNHFLPPNGVTSSAGGWVARRVPQCSAVQTADVGTDPASRGTDPASR